MKLFLFLDYDGTLSPIVSTPEKAVISKETKKVLDKISRKPGFKLAIISGRSLKDIKKMVGIKNIIYSGNHGLEVEGPGIKRRDFCNGEFKSVSREIKNILKKKLACIKGSLIENKGLTLSVHYRLVKNKDIELFNDVVNETVNPYIKDKQVKMNSGKKVYEIKPLVNWDKGKVVSWLMSNNCVESSRNEKIFPIYIGDDVTDENAFKALRKKGLTVHVGEPGKTNADYFLRQQGDVLVFLRNLESIRT